MDERKYILDLFRVVPADSILIIDKSGRLRRLHCPFEVESIGYSRDLEPGRIVQVEAIKMTLALQEVYIIQGQAHYWVYFRIIV